MWSHNQSQKMPHTALQRHLEHRERSSGFFLWILEAEQTLGWLTKCHPPASPADNSLLKGIIQLKILQLGGFFPSWSFMSSSSQPCLLVTHTTQIAHDQGLKTAKTQKSGQATRRNSLHQFLLKMGFVPELEPPNFQFQTSSPYPKLVLDQWWFLLTPDGFHQSHYSHSEIITSAIVNEWSCLSSHFPTNYSELWTTLE